MRQLVGGTWSAPRALLLAAVLAAPGLACDPSLLALILRRDQQGSFEAAAQRLSARLLDAGRAARAEDPAGVEEALRGFLDEWRELYERHYTSPPEGHEAGPAWRARCDALTRAAGGLRRGSGIRDLEALHPQLRDLQDRLADFFMPAPGAGGPAQEFERLRALLAGLKDEAASPGLDLERLGSALERLGARVQALPPESLASPEGRAWASAMGHAREELAADPVAAVAGLEAPLERLRSGTLARLWFPGGRP